MATLATVADFEELTGRSVTGPDVAVVTAQLLRCSSMLRAETGQIISRVEGDVFTIPWGAPAVLPQRPADTPSAITINGQTVTGWQLVGQEIRQLWAWSYYGGFPLVVTYSHGFADDEIPDEVKAVICDAVARNLDNPENIRQVGNVTFGSETIGGPTFTPAELKRARRAIGLPSAVSMSGSWV